MATNQSPIEQWLFQRDGMRYGPVSTQTLQNLCRAGVIVPSASVHHSISDRWSLAGSLPELRNSLAAPVIDPNRMDLLRGIPSVVMADNSGTSGPGFALYPLTPGGTKWFGGLLLICSAGIGALRFSMIPQKSMNARIAEALGAGAIVFLAGAIKGWIWGWIGYAVCGRTRSAANVGFGMFAILLAMAVGFATTQVPMQPPHGVAAVPRPKLEVSASLQKLLGAPKSASAKTLTKLRISADSSALLELMQTVAQERSDSRLKYLSALRSANVDRMLTAQNLANPKAYEVSKRNCNAALHASELYAQEQRAITDGLAARIEAGNISPAAKDTFLAELKKVQGAEEDYLGQIQQIQRQQIGEVVATLKLVQPFATKLSAKNDRINFPKREIADAFNDHVRNLHNLAATETTLQSQRLKDVQERLERFATTVN